MSFEYFTKDPLLGLMLLNCGFAFSQYVVLRAGVFSIGTAGIAALGAYAGAIMVMRYGMPLWVALLAATAIGTAAGFALSIPLARLRGPYQAIATLAFVQIVAFTALYAEDLTGGALGLNNIPHLITNWHILGFVVVVTYFMAAMNRTSIGIAFDAIRQDEVVASSLSVSVANYHTLAFVISGTIAGLFGGLQAFYTYSLDPSQYGFPFVTAVLAFVVFGGRTTVLGPLVGAVLLTALPEVARPLADNRLLVYGLLLMLVIAFIPQGIVDSLREVQRRRKAAAGLLLQTEKSS